MFDLEDLFRDREAERRRKIRKTLLTIGVAGAAAGAAAAAWWYKRKRDKGEGHLPAVPTLPLQQNEPNKAEGKGKGQEAGTPRP